MSWNYRPELDGLRSVAVYLVLLFHTKMVWMQGGFIGVDVFFVLSGFLVTNVIMSEVDRTSRFSLGQFYARRMRRLLPAALLVIVSTSLLWLLVASLPQRLEIIGDAKSALLYFSNWNFIAAANDYFATDTESSPFLHFWSLSIEEQFYAFYPLLLVILLRLGRKRESVILATVAALGLTSLVLQIVVARLDETRAYFGTDTKLYQLLAGAALAFALRALARRAPDDATNAFGHVPGARYAAWAAGAGLVLLLALGTGLLDVSTSLRGILAVAAAATTIAGLTVAPSSTAGRLLARPTPVYLGKISYGTYLWHWPVLLLLGMFLDIRPAVLAVIGGVVATALAALSYQLVETPIRVTPALKPFRWSAVVAGLTVSVLVALVVVPQLLQDTRRPVTASPSEGFTASTATGSDRLNRPVPTGLDYAAIAKKRGPNDRWCHADTLDKCLYHQGDGLTVVLIGDSHARMLAPAFRKLAKEHDFTLYESMVASCPWMKNVYNGYTDPSNAEQCHDARDDFWDKTLPAMNADVVVLTALHRSNPGWEKGLEDLQGRTYPRHEITRKAVPETMEAINDAGARAVIVKSIMATSGWDPKGPNPLDCLARAKKIGDCTVPLPLGQTMVDSFYDYAAASSDKVATLDINPMVCPGRPICSPIIDGRVVWRNYDHLNTAFVNHIRRKIWKAFTEALSQDGLSVDQ